MRLALGFVLAATLAASCAVQAQEIATKGIFSGRGIVKDIAPETGALTLSHDDIKGFMPAMEMMYKVRSADLAKKLRPGDVIDFKIDAANYTIVGVTLVKRAK